MKDFQLLIYNTPTEDIKVDVILKDEDIWASQKAMASLFGVQVPDISKHINNIFESGELTSSTTVSKMETVVQRGFRGQVPDEITSQIGCDSGQELPLRERYPSFRACGIRLL